MKYILPFVALTLLCFILHAQKPALDSSTFGKWPTLNDIKISDDGRYSLFTVVDRLHHVNSLTVRSNDGTWAFTDTSRHFSNPTFSANSQSAFFMCGNDSLGQLSLGRRGVHYLPHIRSFALSVPVNKQWLATLDEDKTLTIRALDGKQLYKTPSVASYTFSPSGQAIVIQTAQPGAIQWLDLASGKSTVIARDQTADQLILSPSGNALAYIVSDTLFYYASGTPRALPLVRRSPEGLPKESFDPSQPVFFNRSGTTLLITLNRPPVAAPIKSPHPNVDIWNYKDKYIQSEQLADFAKTNIDIQKTAVVTVSTGEASIVNHGDGNILNNEDFDKYLLSFIHPYRDNGYTDTASRAEVRLTATADGSTRSIIHLPSEQWPSISPDERFIVWFSADSLEWFSYDIHTQVTRNISKVASAHLYDDSAVAVGRRDAAFPIAGWDTLSRAILLYDKYDLWRISLDGTTPPYNLTNGYGKSHGLVLGLPERPFINQFPVFSSSDNLVFAVYDPNTKNNGFAEIDPRHQDPLLKKMEPACYFIARTGSIGNIAQAHGTIFLKAKNANRYLVQKMSAGQYPNLYVTTDLYTFRPLSDLHPENAYNWIKARLVTWTMTDGRTSSGILYLPENFDSTKKYPVIFNYYEKVSDELHQYKTPAFTGDLINVPYYVSNGYLMFMPDIYYRQDHNGQGVLNAVLSAAKYLSSFSWVDATKMGVQSHSFGGWETNYIVTHSHLFAAAGEGAGSADLISAYDQLSTSGSGRQSFYENSAQGSPYGFGVTPWTRPDIYIENSPIFSVQSVTTPLLMMHGDADPAVPFAQGIEMYLAMQHAGKKVWLLQYEHALHGLSSQNAVDYTIRLKQFFDYYLKGALPPVWMTTGVPASKKGRETGLELDNTGTQP